MGHSLFAKAVIAVFKNKDYEMIARRNGTVEIRRGYFYRTWDPDEWRKGIEDQLTAEGLNVTVTLRDHFANWPRPSYWTAVVAHVGETTS